MPNRPRIDLFADNHPQPSPEMRQYICQAEVGDDTKDEDPTIHLLYSICTELLGKEAILYLPTGTMGNEIAFMVHCRPGDEIIMDKIAHAYHFESGAPAALTGASICGLDGKRGVYTAKQVQEAIRPFDRFSPRTRLVHVEQTSMNGGGNCWPLEQMQAVTSVAKENKLATHLDGARLLLATAATNIPASTYAASFDSVMISLDKGIGAPVGAILAGSHEFIEEARRWKQRLGGSMRSPGFMAAACVFALQNNMVRLPGLIEDAKLLAKLMEDVPGIRNFNENTETDINFFEITAPNVTAQGFRDRLLEKYGIKVGVMGPQRVRMVTNLDITKDIIYEAVAATRDVLNELANSSINLMTMTPVN